MYDDEKLNAIRLYMSQRDLDFKEELEKSVDKRRKMEAFNR